MLKAEAALTSGLKARLSLLIAAVAAMAGALMVLLANWTHGPAVGPDATSYIAAARAILAGRLPEMFDGSPLTWWPPGQPMALALASLITGLDPLHAATFLNAFLFATFIAILAILAFRLSGSAWISLLVAAMPLAGFLSAPFYSTNSEALFIALVSAFLLASDRFATDRSRSAVIWLCVLAAMAALSRYVGIIVIVVGGVLVMLFSEGDLLRRCRRALLWGLAASIPIVLVLFSNWYVTGHPTGPRISASMGLEEVVYRSARGFSKALLPAKVWRSTPHVAVLAAVLLGMLVTLVFWRDPRCRRGFPAALLGTAYIIFTIFLASRTHLYEIGERIFAPAIVPTILFALPLLGSLRLPNFVRLVASVVISLLWLAAITAELRRVQSYAETGAGFTSSAYSENSVLKCYDKFVEDDALIFTNAPELLYLHRDRRAKFVPAREGTPFLAYFGWGINWWVNSLSTNGRPKYVLWFERSGAGDFETPDQMGRIVKLTLVENCGNGALYRIER